MPLPKRELPPVNEAKLRDFLAELDTLRAANPGKPLILYTSFSFSHNYLKLLYQLKKHGALVALHLADANMCGSVPLDPSIHMDFFDALLVSNPYIKELPWLVKNYDFDAVHASVGTSSPYVFREMVNQSVSPTIIDYFDFREVMFDDEGVTQKNFGVDNLELEMEMWGEVFTNSNGIIYLDSHEVVERLSKRHNHTPLSINFQSYVCEEWLDQQRVPPPDNSDRVPDNIVFAGGLHKPTQHGFGVHKSFYDGVMSIVNQGFSYTIFNGCDKTGEGFEQYLETDKKVPGFHYRTAVSNWELPSTLSGYDLGWNAQNNAEGAESAYYHQTLMGSKIYNYLEAGLPCIVSTYTRYMAELVEELNIGIAIDWDQWDDFSAIAAQTDWKGIRKSVAKAQRTQSMEANMPRMVEFYNTACGKEILAAPSGEDA